LAAQENVVVVSINHRLSAFGFMPNDKYSDFIDSSNAGLLDIVAALQWVKHNITQFGGDPNNITIFGESGGASKIAAILSMQTAKGLFHKAIIQSSAGGMQLAKREDVARAYYELAVSLDRPKLSLHELQALPMTTILSALEKVKSTFRGSIDEREFFRDPYYGQAPEIATNIPLLIGCTDHESTYHLRAIDANFSLPMTEIKRRLGLFLQTDNMDIDKIINTYALKKPHLDATGLLVEITTDFIFKRNTYQIASLQARQASAPVYAYLFERRSPIENGRMGSTHTCEIPFIFGTVEQAQACVGSANEPDVLPLTKIMMATWAAFARDGNPGNKLVPRWQPLSGDGFAIMNLNVNSHMSDWHINSACSALDHLDYFGYNHGLKQLVHG
jgi:para-nitrobenzyl esterase